MSSTPTWAVRTKSDEAFIDQGGTFDPSRGDRVCQFLDTFLTLENGQPFKVLDWQRQCIHSWYSWVRPDGRRRAKVGLLTLARKNGKTELLTGLTAYHLLADNELSPSCVSCAVDKAQAAQIFDKLNWSIQNNTKLREALDPKPSYKEIRYNAKNGKYKSASSDSAGKFGHGHSFVVYDELAFHKNDGLYTALQNSTDSRPNGLQIIISTAGWNKNGVFWRLYQYARQIIAGDVVDPSFVPWIYETPDTADLDDPAAWRLANPSLGVTLNEDDFGAQWARAKRDVAGRLDFTRLKFNSWTEGQAGWIPPEKWEGCEVKPFPDLKGQPVYLAVDAGMTQDLTAVSLVAPMGGKFYVKSWGLVPSKAAEDRERENLTSYQRFTLDGSLKIVPGNAVGIEADIYPLLDRLIAEHDVQGLIVDEWQLLQLSQHYMARGVKTYRFKPWHSRFNEPTLALERAVLDGPLVHDGNALLRWQIGHVQLDRDGAGYVKPKKPTAAAKIDNVVSVIMAMSMAIHHGEEPVKKSVYEDRGVFVF